MALRELACARTSWRTADSSRFRILIRANPHYVKPVSKPRFILIAGPTASGKSALALALAEKLGGTIVNADSMQVYRDLRIITARPTADEECACRIGSMAMSMRRRIFPSAAGARRRRRRSRRRGASRAPVIVVGGTGLYFNALTRGLAAVPPIPADIRAGVRARLASEGVAALHAELARPIRRRRRG